MTTDTTGRPVLVDVCNEGKKFSRVPTHTTSVDPAVSRPTENVPSWETLQPSTWLVVEYVHSKATRVNGRAFTEIKVTQTESSVI